MAVLILWTWWPPARWCRPITPCSRPRPWIPTWTTPGWRASRIRRWWQPRRTCAEIPTAPDARPVPTTSTRRPASPARLDAPSVKWPPAGASDQEGARSPVDRRVDLVRPVRQQRRRQLPPPTTPSWPPLPPPPRCPTSAPGSAATPPTAASGSGPPTTCSSTCALTRLLCRMQCWARRPPAGFRPTTRCSSARTPPRRWARCRPPVTTRTASRRCCRRPWRPRGCPAYRRTRLWPSTLRRTRYTGPGWARRTRSPMSRGDRLSVKPIISLEESPCRRVPLPAARGPRW